MKPAPQVAAIQDLTGFGRCSAAIVLPVLAAMGNQCSTLLTAYLSAHTGFPASEQAVFLDLTAQMQGCYQHWAELGASFDAIYSGFLGSEHQIDLIEDFISRFRRPGTLVLVDPVMGDHGRAYATCTAPLRAKMATLARRADLITPNLTEAALLLGEPYEAAPRTKEGVEDWLTRLSLGGGRSVVLTGVSLAEGQVGAASFDRTDGSLSFSQTREEPGSFPGTGDLFASVLLGGLLRGKTLPESVDLAVSFVREAVSATLALGSDPLMGVQFEPLLGRLALS